jgi:hypothetical protein
VLAWDAPRVLGHVPCGRSCTSQLPVPLPDRAVMTPGFENFSEDPAFHGFEPGSSVSVLLLEVGGGELRVSRRGRAGRLSGSRVQTPDPATNSQPATDENAHCRHRVRTRSKDHREQTARRIKDPPSRSRPTISTRHTSHTRKAGARTKIRELSPTPARDRSTRARARTRSARDDRFALDTTPLLQGSRARKADPRCSSHPRSS